MWWMCVFSVLNEKLPAAGVITRTPLSRCGAWGIALGMRLRYEAFLAMVCFL